MAIVLGDLSTTTATVVAPSTSGKVKTAWEHAPRSAEMPTDARRMGYATSNGREIETQLADFRAVSLRGKLGARARQHRDRRHGR